MTSADPRPRRGLPLRARILLPLFAILLGLATWRLYGAPDPRPVIEFRGEALGTTWTVKLAARDLGREREAAVVDTIRERIARVDALMSTWKPDSELSRLNRQPAGAPFPVARETLAVFRLAREVSELSGGAFDVTVAPAVRAWGFGAGALERPPSPAEIDALRARIDYRHLALDAGSPAVTRLRAGVIADLSAIAKGYAVDEVARGLEALDQTRFLVEIGGELRARGTHLDGGAWRVAIEAPTEEGRAIHRIVALRDLSMATSGDYRSYREVGGRRVSHTIDPRTARPIAHGLASVTVLDPEAARADALATALNVLGPDAGYDLARKHGIPAYFIVREADGAFRTWATGSFEPHLARRSPVGTAATLTAWRRDSEACRS